MIIIGGGIAGRMAAGYFSSFSPQVYEGRGEGTVSHNGIMRFRDRSVGYLLGVSLKKISVKKFVYYKGDFVSPNPMMLNLYSMKVARGIFSRSISSIGEADRYVSRDNFSIPLASYGHALTEISPNRCVFSNGESVEYDFCVSTIPLPAICKAASLDIGNLGLGSYPIYILRYRIATPSDVYQTIYFPDPDTNIYRASLEEQELIIESNGEISPHVDVPEVCMAFGIGLHDLCDERSYIQNYGKIAPFDDSSRKRIIMELSEKFSVYSLGRYATWRNITSDVLLEDLDRISDLMKLSDHARKYSMTLGGV